LNLSRAKVVTAAILTGAFMLPAGRCAPADSPVVGITAVSSRVFGGYVRARLADGMLRPETYAFGNGGLITAGSAGGETPGAQRDPSIDEMNFDSIARAMEEPLSSQGYRQSKVPEATDLLVMVYWGTTVGGFHEKKGKFRDILDLKNAQLLGFDSEGTFGAGFGNNVASNINKQVHSQMMAALEVSRYFVVLRGFDFQSSWKDKKLKLLWETRFSIDQRHNDFDLALPVMAQYASPCFGQDSGGLMLTRVADGRVILGDIKSLGEVPPAPK
jgi:hypothetical protein